MFVNATKIYQFKAKDSEIKDYSLRLGNISKDFAINKIKLKKKKTHRIKRSCKKFFCADFNPIDTKNIINIHKCLMERT